VAYDVEMADRLREILAGEPDVIEKSMFGGWPSWSPGTWPSP